MPAEPSRRGRTQAFFASLLLLLAGPARADDNAQGFHRDLSGRQWVVVSDPAGSYRLRRFDSGGALLGEVSLSSAASDSSFKIASGPGGDAWVAGGTSDGGPVGLGVWRVSADGQTLISSTAIYGSFDIYPGGVAVDASSRAWIAAVETLDAGLSGARFALWRFEADGALSSGFPVFHQRESGVFDGGLSISLDGDGDVWSAGVSSRPAAAAFDLALWRFSPSGVLREGFPVYRGDTFKTLDDLDASLVIAPGGKAWVASSQLFPGCTDQQQALFRFDASGNVEFQRYWHNSAETASNSRSIALASDGGPWVLGQSGGSAAVWSYDSFGDLLPGYPRTDSNLFSESLALDAGDAPWVVYGSTPGAFVGAQSVAGAPGLPACAQPPSGTLSGSVIVDGGAPAGSTVAIVASSDGFDQDTFLEIFVSTGGASVPFSISVPTPGDYALGAFLGDDPELIDPSTPIAFYQGFAPVSLAPGGSASGIDFAIALDLEDPLVAVTFPVSGSTISALPVIEGTASDANGIDGIDLAVQDLDSGLWWDPNLPAWTASGEAIYEYASAEPEGTPAAIAWSVTIAGADFGSFAHLDERLTRGRRYRVLALTSDFVGRESAPAEVTFTWNGGQPPPADLSGEALGVSSIAWSWSAVPNATSYHLATSSFTAPFASVTATSYIEEGLSPSQNRRLCVAAAGDEAAEPYACAFADADPAAPGAPSASEVGTDRITWSWPSGGNTGDAGYELTISADGFVSDVSTPVAAGAAFKGTSFEVTGLSPDVEYAARVRAYNAGLKLSDYSLAGSTRTEPAGPPAEFFSHGFHRDLTGRQWVVVSGETGAFSLRRFDSAGVLLGAVPLSGAVDESDFKIVSGQDGDAWVSGAVSDGGPAGFGVWRVSADGQALISSAAVYGSFDIYPGGVAVDASSRAWVPAAEALDSTGSFRFALWRFENDGSLSSGFPVSQRRENGVLDAGLSIAVDSAGDVWSAGVSSNPAATAYDLALWRFDPNGVLRPGFPVYRGSAFASLEEIDSGIVIAAGDKVWVASSQLFPGCADRQQALLRFDRDGAVELQRYWHNAAENESTGETIALASDGSPWMLGRSSHTTAVWSYDRFGELLPGYPRTDENLGLGGIALDSGDVPWVVYGSTPGAFVGAQTVAGAVGPPSCAQLPAGTISGSVIVEGGAPAGSTVTVIASADGFNENTTTAIALSTGGASVPFAIELVTAGDYVIGAFLGDDPEAVSPSTPIGFYRDFTPISLAPGASASGVDFTIALDTVAPVAAVSFPVAGSTVAALPVIEGSAADANGVGDFDLAVQDVVAGLWYDPNAGWTESASPVYGSVNAEFSGSPNAIDWTVAISSVDNGNFGRLDERLVQGRTYRVLALGQDFVGNLSAPAETTFTWDGPTGNVGPQAPSGFNGQSLGTSSIAWSWEASPGATAYFLASSSYTTPFASVTTTSYISEGLLPAESRFLCVAGVNLLTAGDYNCTTAETDAAVPGAVVAAEVWGTSIAWSWTNGGNSGDARYELSLSTDGFAAHVSTPAPVGSFLANTNFTTEGLTPDTVYTARVRAYNLGQKLSDFSESGSTRTTVIAPETPYNLTGLVDRGEAAVSLSWSTSGIVAASSYRVYRSTVFASLSLLATTTATFYVDFPTGSAFYFYSVSAVGDLGGESPPTVQNAVRFDVTAPTVAFVQPEDGATLSRPYTVMAEASDDFTSATVRFEVDGVARATTTVSHQFLWDIRAETDGPHTLSAVAVDDDGNETSISRSVTVAYSTPVPPSIFFPSDDYSTTDTVLSVSGFATPLTSVRVLADAVVIGTAVPNELGQWGLFEAPFPGRGDFLLTAVTFEDRGESFASAPLRIASYAEPPAAPASVSAAVDRESARVELSWDASAGPTPATAYRVERATSATGEYQIVASTPTTSYSDILFQSGEYHYRVRAHHGSGLFSAYVSTSATFDATPPAAISDLRVTAYRPEAGELDLAWTAVGDDFSGVARQLLVRSPGGLFDGDSSTITLAAVAAGTTSTYTVAVSTGMESFRVFTEDAADNRSSASNTAVHDTIPPEFEFANLDDGQVVTRPRFVNVTASDNIGVTRLVFILNGSTEADVAASSYSFFWDIRDWTDGEVEFVVDAYDAAGNKDYILLDATISYAPPAAPVIYSPSNGFGTQVATITIAGSSDPGVNIDLLVNGLDVATTSAESGFWSFQDLRLPGEGDIRLTAIAFESRGFSSPSTAVNGVYSATVPEPPEFVNAEAGSEGRSLLSWQEPTGGKRPTFYRVYRSTDDALLGAGQPPPPLLPPAGQTSSLQYSETPALDDLYFYAVTSVDGAGRESVQSAVVYVLTDRVPPAAAVSFTTAPPFGVGDHPVLLTLSEPLSDSPLFTFTPPGGQPEALSAAPVTATLWRTTVTVTSAMTSGDGVIAFQGVDLAGNVGLGVSSGTFALDTAGPIGVVTLSKPSPVPAGPLTFTLTLDEPSLSTPTLVFTAQEGAPLPVSLTQAGEGDNRTWSGGITVDAFTGEGLAGLSGYSASDVLGNLGVTLLGSTTFLIDTLATNPPRVLRANSLPGAVILLSWSAPLGEQPAFYHILRDGVTLSTQVPVSETDGSGSYTDAATEGVHDYSASAFDAAGNESEAVTAQGTAKASPPAPPFDVSAAIGSFGQVQLNWQSGSEDTLTYRLYRATYPFTSLAGLTFRAAAPPFPDAPTVNGTYHYAVTGLDFATNESTMSAQAVVVWDQSAPTIVIGGFEDKGFFNADVAPVFAAFDLQLDTATVQGTLDGQPFVSGSTVSAEGPHVLSVTAATLGGHAAFSSATFTLDKTPPAIVFGGIAEGAQIVSTVPISAFVTITDTNPVTTSVFLTNALLNVTNPYGNGDAIHRNGNYSLTASATDIAGNSSTSTLSFRLQIGPIAPTPLAVRIQGSARLSWTAPEPGLAGYRVYRDGTRISASLFTGTFFEDTGFTPGTHVYEVSAVDAAGAEGPRARATVPAVTLGLRDAVLTRGFFDSLAVTLTNDTTNLVHIGGPIALTLRDALGATAADSSAFGSAALPNAVGVFEGVFAVPVALTTNCVVNVSMPLQTANPTYSVTLAGDFQLQSREPAQPLLEVFPGTLVLGTPSPVQVRLYNRGTAPMDVVTAQIANSTVAAVDDVTVRLLTAEGTLLASGGIAQNQNGAQSAFVDGRQIFFVTVPAGGSFLLDPVRVVVPNTAAGTLRVAASVSTPTYSRAFNSIPGTRGFVSSQAQATVSQVPYLATVVPSQAVYDQGSVVSVSGQALDIGDGSPVPNSPVEVHFVSNGFDRHVDAVTNSSGSYQAFFFPLPSEAGVYSLFASHPDVVTHAVTSSFTIVGFEYEFSSFTADLAQNSSLPFSFKLTNTGATPLEGLQISTISLINGEGLVLTLDTATLPSTLAPGAAVTLNLTVAAAPTASSGTFQFALAEAHGFTRSIPVTVTVFPAEVIAKLTPSQFSVGMLGGDSRTISVTVENVGFDTWRGVTVTAPALEWVTVQGSGLLGDIPPRGNATFILSLDPPLSLSNGTYAPTPLLQLTSLNTPPVGLPAAIAITSSRKGDAAFSVINADKPRIGTQGVPIPQAVATVVSLDVEALSFKAIGDANGLASFSQIPAGKYSWNVSVQGFQTKSGNLTIEPGLTQSIEVVLPTTVVSFEWKVTPTRIQDKYDIVLDLTFKTDVPAPIIVMDPPILDLYMVGGQSILTQFTMTNKGLVTALDVKVNFGGDEAITVESPIDVIPRLEPGQTVTIPAKITLAHASCHSAGASIFAHYLCIAGIDVSALFSGTRITAGTNCGGGSIASGGGYAGGGGAGGPVSGGYIDYGGFTGSNGVTCATTPSGDPEPSCGERCNTPSNPPPNPSPVPPPPVPPLPPPPSSCDCPPCSDDASNGPDMSQAYASPGLDATPRYSSGKPEDGPWGFGWFSEMHLSVKLRSNGSLMSVDERGNQLIYAPLNNPPDGYTAFYAQPINTRTALQGLDVSNGKPNTVLQSYPDGSTIRYSRFGTSDYLPAVLTDRNGNVITYERDPSGRLLEARDVHNRFISFTYNAAGRIASTTDNAGRTTSHIYDASGNRISDTDVNGDVTQYQYGGFGSHQITQITYPNGGKTFKTYRSDSPYSGRLATVSDDGGVNLVTYGHENADTKATETDALSHVTAYDFIQNSGMKRISKVTDALGGETNFTYDADMRTASITDSLGRTTAFRYDSNGNQVATVDPLGQVTQTVYNARFNSVASMTDPKGNKTSYFYDAKGNLIQVKDAAGGFTTWTYDKQGHPVAVKDALGNVMSTVYNGNGAATSVSDPLGRTVSMTRDNLNRVTRYSDPAGKQTDLTYNPSGTITQVKDALNGITAFDYRAGRGGRQLHVLTDAKNHTTTMNYDIQGRVTSAVNALGQSSAVSYDAKNRTTNVTTRNGQTINFAYDNLDRLTLLSAPEGNLGMTYDASGRLLTASNFNGSVLTMAYDAADRVTQVVQALPNSHSVTINYTYDLNGNRTSMTTPWGSFNYAYDSLDRVTNLTNPRGQSITFAYDALGRRTRMEYPNGIRARYAYDAAGQITQVLHEKAISQTAIAFKSYEYDISGNQTAITDISGMHAFSYDALNRLTGAEHPAMSSLPIKSETFNYDAVGNRAADSERTNYEYNNANRIISDSSFTYTSDANGNITSRTDRVTGLTTELVHDNGNQLTEVNESGSAVGIYKYNSGGRRVEKNVGGVITRFIYDGPNILAILDDNNNLLTLFTHGPGIDSPLIMRKEGLDFFYHVDALGSVMALTGENGNVVELYEYQAFGWPVVKDTQGGLHDVSTVGNPFMYTSREYDAETGFYYYRARYYDPEMGRFLQEDPLGFDGGDVNLYAYVENNPLINIDPLGLQVSNPGGYSFVPVVGPIWEASYQWEQGNYGLYALNVGIASADVLTMGSFAASRAYLLKFGSHSWGNSVRPWLGKVGFAEAGQPVHHWLIPQNGWGKYIAAGIKNQPFNLMPMRSRAFHDMIEGKGSKAYGLAGRLYHGSPGWAKSAVGSMLGRTANKNTQEQDCR